MADTTAWAWHMVSRCLAMTVLLMLPASTYGADAATRPNILFLLGDDLTSAELGCYGGQYARTPAIDRLATDGVLFENSFVTTSICACNRACILAGQHQRTTGIKDFDTPFSPEALAKTYPLLLKSAGYRIGFIGKWGIAAKPPEMKHPATQFDFWRGLPGQAGYWYGDGGFLFEHASSGTPPSPDSLHEADQFPNDVAEFLAGCPADQPWCLSISFKSVHPPRAPHPSLADRFAGDDAPPLPATCTEAAYATVPEHLRRSYNGCDARRGTRWLESLGEAGLRRNYGHYLRSVETLDLTIARIVAVLEAHGVANDTVIILHGDNGTMNGQKGLIGKWIMYEPSIRVPTIVVDPRRPADRRGIRVKGMALSIDLAPTMLALAGIAKAECMQGESLLTLLADPAAPWRTDWFYEHTYPGKPDNPIAKSEGVRSDRWKYIRWLDPQPHVEELFDLDNDPDELKNLAAEPAHRAKLDELRARYQHWRKVLPDKLPDPDEYAGNPVVAAAPPAARPNVIFILMDDLGWRDTGFSGSTFHETPNIDRLSRLGVVLTHAYAAAPICSPTRASCLTGLHPARVGITQPVCSSEVEVLEAVVQTRVPTPEEMKTKSHSDPTILKGPQNPRALQVVSATRLKREYTTIAELMRASGYRTGHFGKWHLGPPPYSALEQGFDVQVPHANTPGPLRPGHLGPWPDWPGADGEAFKGRHIDDVLADHAIEFIDESAKGDRPFFIDFWPFGVHLPYQARQELITHFRPKADPQAGQRNPLYAAMIKHTDDAIGRLWKAVEDAGLADQTVVVFLSDNGGVTNRMSRGGEKYGLKGVPVTDNAPLRGHKGDIYEGGVRIPGFIVWPGMTTSGSTCDVPFSSVDAFATIAEICGLANVPHADGRSFAAALRGQPFAEKPVFVHRPHYGHFGIPPGTSVVSEGWKLIRFQFDGPDQTDRHELYRLTDDPGETRNVAADHPDVVARLGRLIDNFVSDTGAVLPRKNPEYRPEAAAPHSSQARPPNILFVVVDDLNDWVYHEPGHPPTLTPQIDRLMAGGMRFLNAHVAAPVCNPSRVAMLTGRSPTSTGIYAIPQYMRDAPRLKDAPTLMQTLRAHGYTTWGAGKVFHHFSGENLWSDPESWDEYAPFPGSGSRTGLPAHGMVEPGTDTPAVLGEFDWGPCNSNKRDADSMVDIRNARWAAEKLSEPADRPFFLAVGIMKPHLPWYVPQEYFDRHDISGLPLPPTTDDDLADVPPRGREIAMTAPGANPGGTGPRNFHREFTADTQRWREAMRGYLACMSLADDAVGILLDALEQGPHAGSTIVVLVSDHGWHFGEKEHWQKYTLWEEATRVPLVIAAPGFTAAGTATTSPVSLLDLYPTLVDLAGLTPPPGLDGESLLPLLRDTQACRQRLVVTTHSRGSHAVRSDQYRYIRYADGTEELYDHASDPNEWTNLATRPEMTAVKATLAAALPLEEADNVPRSDIRAPRFRCERPGATASETDTP